jgi:hypothetical protein
MRSLAFTVSISQAAVASLERDVEAERHATAAEKKRLAELAHERDVLNKLRTQVRLSAPAACQLWSVLLLVLCTARTIEACCDGNKVVVFCMLNNVPQFVLVLCCSRQTLPHRSSMTLCA